MKLRKTNLFESINSPLRSKFAWGAYDKSSKTITFAMWEPEVHWNKNTGIARVWVNPINEPDKRKNPNNTERGEMVLKVKNGFPCYCLLSKNDPDKKAEFGELDIQNDFIYKVKDIIDNGNSYYAIFEKHTTIADFINSQ